MIRFSICRCSCPSGYFYAIAFKRRITSQNSQGLWPLLALSRNTANKIKSPKNPHFQVVWVYKVVMPLEGVILWK